MPNGKTHDRITHLTLPLVGIGAALLMPKIQPDIKIGGILMFTLILTVSYYFSSMMFNGDLDTNSKPYNRWWLLKMIWIPYQLLFSHRSIFTHGIIIGTVVRLLYLSPIIILFFLIFNVNLQSINWIFTIPILIGLELGNTIHTVSDAIRSEI